MEGRMHGRGGGGVGDAGGCGARARRHVPGMCPACVRHVRHLCSHESTTSM